MKASVARSFKIIAAFIVGQLVQTLVFVVAMKMYVRRPCLWTAAAGFIIAVAVFLGGRVIAKELTSDTARSSGHAR